MDIMPGKLSRIIFHRFDLPLPVLSLQQLRRPLHIQTPLFSANSVNMWCMECIWISCCMRLSDRAPVCMGGEFFFAFSDFGCHFSLESSGRLRGCWAGSGSGRSCMHASIAVTRGGAWSAPHPWIPDLCCPRCVGPLDPVRAGNRLPLHYRCATSPRTAPHPALPLPTLTGPYLPVYPVCLPLHHAHPPLCFPDLTYLSVCLCFCYCSLAGLHCTMQPILAVKTSAPCSWRRGLTSQLEPR